MGLAKFCNALLLDLKWKNGLFDLKKKRKKNGLSETGSRQLGPRSNKPVNFPCVKRWFNYAFLKDSAITYVVTESIPGWQQHLCVNALHSVISHDKENYRNKRRLILLRQLCKRIQYFDLPK